ncbi:MAG: hypothetical protein WDN30_05585 [Pararobbsia sp.]
MKVRLLRGLALLTGLSCMLAALPVRAQVSAPLVHWRLEVLENGETVDTFQADTPLEQTQTETREHDATHVVGCAEQPAAHIELTRNIAVTPSTVDARGVSFMIDATEMLEDDAAQQTHEGCTLPPQPRVVHATHPALLVDKSGWTDWQVVAHDPVLVYRLQASVAQSVPPDAAPGTGAVSGATSGAAAGPSSGSIPTPTATPTSSSGSSTGPVGVAPGTAQPASGAPPADTAGGSPAAPDDDDAPDAGVPDVTVPDDNPSH